jgi:hypothetical protein
VLHHGAVPRLPRRRGAQPPLAARAAAESGQFEEALKAIEALEGKPVEGLALRAVIAYERGDVIALGDVTDALQGKAPSAREVIDLLPALLVGGPVPRSLDPAVLERPGLLWGRLALADTALLGGDARAAAKALEGLPADAGPVARRRAQLARLGGRGEDALAHSAVALKGGPTALALIERVRCLVLSGQLEQARELAESRSSLLGSLGPWLLVHLDLEQGRAPRAKARALSLPEPPAESPLALRVLVAQALVGVGDRLRGRPLLQQLHRQAPRHPEVKALPPRL